MPQFHVALKIIQIQPFHLKVERSLSFIAGASDSTTMAAHLHLHYEALDLISSPSRPPFPFARPIVVHPHLYRKALDPVNTTIVTAVGAAHPYIHQILFPLCHKLQIWSVRTSKRATSGRRLSLPVQIRPQVHGVEHDAFFLLLKLLLQRLQCLQLCTNNQNISEILVQK